MYCQMCCRFGFAVVTFAITFYRHNQFPNASITLKVRPRPGQTSNQSVHTSQKTNSLSESLDEFLGFTPFFLSAGYRYWFYPRLTHMAHGRLNWQLFILDNPELIKIPKITHATQNWIIGFKMIKYGPQNRSLQPSFFNHVPRFLGVPKFETCT